MNEGDKLIKKFFVNLKKAIGKLRNQTPHIVVVGETKIGMCRSVIMVSSIRGKENHARV